MDKSPAAKMRQKPPAPSRSARADASSQEAENEQLGIQSIEVGMGLVAALVELTASAPPPMLKTLAEAAGMAPAKAHRYMVSLIRTGMIERDPISGRYRLGPVARDFGFSAIRSIDLVKLGGARLTELCADLKQTVALAIWTYNGPTIVCVEEYRRPVAIVTRVGEIMPILSSATGRVFAAWLPRSQTQEFIDGELKANRNCRKPGLITSAQEVDRALDQTRAAGLGWTEGGINPTVNALSVPLFDYRGVIVGAISSLGPADDFDVSPTGRLATCLLAAGKEFSRELGYRE